MNFRKFVKIKSNCVLSSIKSTLQFLLHDFVAFKKWNSPHRKASTRRFVLFGLNNHRYNSGDLKPSKRRVERQVDGIVDPKEIKEIR